MMNIDNRKTGAVRGGNAQTLFLPTYDLICLFDRFLHALSLRSGGGRSGGVQC